MRPKTHTTHALKVAVSHLKAGRAQEAARVLIHDLQYTAVPPQVDLGKWLVRSIGEKPAVKLIQALAYYPCFYCKNGLEDCGLCGSRRTNAAGRSCCEHCLDLLKVRCDFCGGSGWITYHDLPSGLWPAVILVRTRAALSEFSTLAKHGLPATASAAPSSARRLLERQLLILNRLAGILENTADATKKYTAQNGPAFKPVAARVLNTVAAAWEKMQTRLRNTLLLLGDTLRREAIHAETKKARAIMIDRADFYRMLAKSRAFEGTSLFRPLLPTRRRTGGHGLPGHPTAPKSRDRLQTASTAHPRPRQLAPPPARRAISKRRNSPAKHPLRRRKPFRGSVD